LRQPIWRLRSVAAPALEHQTQRQVANDARQRQRTGIGHVEVGTRAISQRPEDFSATRLGVEQHVPAQCGQVAINSKLFAAVVALGAGSEHFNDEHRRGDHQVVGCELFVAGDQQVGLEDGIVADLDLHRFARDLEGAIFKVIAQMPTQVGDDPVVAACAAHHAEPVTPKEFMALWLPVFPGHEFD
jgi:hypothetical protein